MSPLDAYYRAVGDEITQKFREVMERGHLILGEEVRAFETEFATYCQAKHCVGVANGLDALVLILRSLGLRKGDEVVVPANTYTATWLAVTHVGAIPVPVDPNPLTFNIEAPKILESLSERTRAIMVVDLYGQPADVDDIRELAEARGLALIDDAAQSHGASYRGKTVGGHGPICGFSFYPTKNLGAIGDAGAVVTNDSTIAESVRELRNYGTRERYVSRSLGVNSRLDEVQAAVLRVKLRYLDAWNKRRRAIARQYEEQIVNDRVITPRHPLFVQPAWHQFVIRTTERERLITFLRKREVETLIHYPVPPHLQPAYEYLSIRRGALPVSERLAEEVLSIPMSPFLTDDEVRFVAEAMCEFS